MMQGMPRRRSSDTYAPAFVDLIDESRLAMSP